MVVAPSRGAADDFVRRALGRLDLPGVLGVERTTGHQLATSLAALRLADAGQAPLGGIATSAVVTRIARRAHARGALGRLAPVATLHGFPRALGDTLRELREAGLSASELDPAARAALGDDLSHLLAAYEEQLGEWGLADLADRLAAATAALREGDAVAGFLRGRPQVWLDVPLHDAMHRSFFVALAGVAAGEVCWSAAAGDDETLAALDASAELRGLFGEALDLDAEAAPPVSLLERTQRYVFQPDVPPLESAVVSTAESSTFDFVSAAGEGRECVEIARRIRDLALDGVAFDEVAVAVHQPSTYLPLLEDALRRAEIPAYFSRGLSRPDPAGRAFLSLLACAAEELSATRFAEYLSLGQVPQPQADGSPLERSVPWVEPRGEQLVLKSLTDSGEVEQGDEEALEPLFRSESDPESEPSERLPAGALPTPERWEQFLVDAAVVGGSARWRRRLAGLEAEWRRQLAERDDDLEETSLARRRVDLERLAALRRFALPLIERLEQLPEGGSWQQWLVALEQLAVRALRRPGSVLQLLAELRPMAEVSPVTIDQVRQTLSEPLSFLRAEPPRSRFGRVFVATTAELGGRSFSAVFLPGLAESVFPRRQFEDPLLLDRQRLALRGSDGDGDGSVWLPTRGDRAHRERLLLRIAVGAARERLVVSYPRVDLGQGRSRVPSFYALDLLRAAEGELPPELGELAQRAAAANASQIGWPAPAAASEAIDAAEYDLAHLRAAMGLEDSRGSARFLLDTNPYLARSLRARFWRWNRRWTWADGLVARADDEPGPGLPIETGRQTRELLREHLPSARAYSPTALQHFAHCPYRFLLQAVHRLRPKLEVAGLEKLDPLTRGSLFHDIQFDLLQQLRREGLVPVTLDNLDQVIARLDEVVDTAERRFAEELAPAIPRIWSGEIETLRNDLRGWLRQIAEEPGWTPIAAELAFGLPEDPRRDPASSTEPVPVLDGAASLRGSIDLVEREVDGSRVRVVDHKTGRPPQKQYLTIDGGRVLQPVLYALAAEKLLETDGGEGAPAQRVVEGRLHFCTQRGEYQVRSVALDVDSRAAARSVIEQVEAAVREGFLPAAPAEKACQWCDYRVVCGPYEEHRVSRKSPRALEPLTRLRRAP